MDFPYTIKKHKRAKRIKITIDSTGLVRVTVPYRLPKILGDIFVKQHTDWIKQKIEHIKQNPQFSLKGNSAEYKKYKEDARKLAHTRVEFFNKYYNFIYNDIRIKNTKHTWGSCSKKGNLNFNYKITLISPEAADYIVVHELCHLKEFNHSKSFWDLVGLMIPDYKNIRKNLKGRNCS